MAGNMVLYRGSLKSCNYRCSYCPFSKHRTSDRELETDRIQWLRFCNSLADKAAWQKTGAVLVTPYGEALIHSWYWEGLARITGLEHIEAAGAQTNGSFPVKQCLEYFDAAGGRREKLRLWITFHPEMILVSDFADRCRLLMKEGILFSVGAVGVPDNIHLLRQLRQELPSDIYFWINRMDGCKRPYTPEETAAFQKIDPFFSQELLRRTSDVGQCTHRFFVEADGTFRYCNISRTRAGNWYELPQDNPPSTCGRNACTCYLAYGGRKDYKHLFTFGRYPLFRVPWKPKAFFLDIDGTLFPEKKNTSDLTCLRSRLEQLKANYPLFLATSRPYPDAVRCCGSVFGLFEGGIFAGGAHILLKETDTRKAKEEFCIFDTPWLPLLINRQKELGCRVRTYGSQNGIYKVTLVRPSHKSWREEELTAIQRLLPAGSCRCFTEENCFQITAPGVDKGSGLAKLCGWLGLSPKDTAVVGNSREDLPMLCSCGFGIAVGNDCPEAVQEADLHLDHRQPFSNSC